MGNSLGYARRHAPRFPPSGNGWVRNPIDRFVLARLEPRACSPRRRPTRRRSSAALTLDLTGLPPTAAEVDAFLADRSPDAYEKARRPPARIAALRRADGDALARLRALRRHATATRSTASRDMWPWRDWVIDAFNRNLPFDRFTVEQTRRRPAARTPPATRRSPPASTATTGQQRGRHRSPRSSASRTSSIASRPRPHVWLGLTMGCARCHDHKYRSDHAEGVLPVLRVLQQRARAGAGGQGRQLVAVDQGADAARADGLASLHVEDLATKTQQARAGRFASAQDELGASVRPRLSSAPGVDGSLPGGRRFLYPRGTSGPRRQPRQNRPTLPRGRAPVYSGPAGSAFALDGRALSRRRRRRAGSATSDKGHERLDQACRLA